MTISPHIIRNIVFFTTLSVPRSWSYHKDQGSVHLVETLRSRYVDEENAWSKRRIGHVSKLWTECDEIRPTYFSTRWARTEIDQFYCGL